MTEDQLSAGRLRKVSIRRRLGTCLAALALCAVSVAPAEAKAPPKSGPPAITPASKMITAADRQAAAERAAANKAAGKDQAKPAATPLGTPDYFGTTPNYANSPLPTVNGATVTGGIRKFVDSLAGLGSANANDLGQYMPVAVPDKTTYPGSDYYEIGLVQFKEQMSSDLPATLLRGYVQLETPVNASTSKHIPLTNTLLNGNLNRAVDANGNQVYGYDNPHYLGPSIIAQHNVPVRVKFSNLLPVGSGGDLFIPLDTTDMGAGGGPVDLNGNPCDPMMVSTCAPYSQNRATLHLHGGTTPWISDGTPNQWTTPAGQVTKYPKGVSVQNVPDMPDPGPGSLTFFYTNQESARLLFYHDHAYGITRLNVYAGEASSYLIQDATEQALVANGTIPTDQIPLVIQDKTFVPGPAQLAAEDPTWDTAQYGGMGNLWFPHVYMPNQNPTDAEGVNAMGRWDYGPWFWPPYSGLANGPVANPLSGTTPEEGPVNPGTPNPSLVPESFMDTMLVNGTVYPYLQVGQKAYRFRILNASNDRTLNLQLYYAKSNATMWNPDGTLNDANAGEVTMTAAISGTPATAGYPADINDGRDGGVPDVRTQGPAMTQIGTEAGFLPNPVTLSDSPVGYNYNRRDITVLNVSTKSLMLGPAERADIIVDFSQVPDGSKLILYNDAPAPVPAFDPRYDYYTGDPDQTATGGAPSTLPGYGPNTRTIMQIQVTSAKGTAAAFNAAALATALPAAFAATQHQPVVPEAAFNAAYGTTSTNTYVRIQDTKITFTPYGTTTPLTLNLQPKAIQELFEVQYGRMNATLGVELPNTTGVNQTTVPLGYAEPYTEELVPSDLGTPVGTLGDGTQIWKITHNGVDTHAIHFHLFDVQLINRVGWDGMVKAPDPNEVGWKETVRMNPLEDAIVALRPVQPLVPFGLPDSIRAIDVTRPVGAPIDTFNTTNATPITVPNAIVNYGWEYVWHCHLLGHEENDMMRPVVFRVPSTLPAAPALTFTSSGGNVVLTWTDGTPVTTTLGTGSNWGNPASEIGFRVMRATVASGSIGAYSLLTTTMANITTYTDTTAVAGAQYAYQVVAFNAAGNSLSNAVRYPSGTYFTVTPNRILDSRSTAKIGLTASLVSGTAKTFQVTNRTPTVPATNIPAAAVAVTGNLTVAGQTSAGYLSLTAVATNSPATSTLNFPTADTRSNDVTVALGPGGTLGVVFKGTTGAKTDVIFDVTGYFLPDSTGATYVALTPSRLVDTKVGTGIATKLTANTAKLFQVENLQSGNVALNVPASAIAVTGVLTVVNPTKAGYLALTPNSTNNPTVSTVNFPVGDTRSNGVTVPLSASGKLSVVYIAAAGATADVFFDVTGYFLPGTSGASYVWVTPNRVVDTRATSRVGPLSGLSGGNSKSFPVTGYTPTDALKTVPANAVAVTGNLTILNQTAAGYMTVQPIKSNTPTTASVYAPVGDIRADGITIGVGPGGTLGVVYMAATGSRTDFLFDIEGYFV